MRGDAAGCRNLILAFVAQRKARCRVSWGGLMGAIVLTPRGRSGLFTFQDFNRKDREVDAKDAKGGSVFAGI